MTTELDFLDAVIASPDDISVRLVAADWYEEQGDPRGEFIRLQIRSEEPECGTSERLELEARAAELEASHAAAWDRPLHRRLTAVGLVGQVGPLPLPIRGWTYRRGFVEELVVRASTFVQHREVLCELGPIRAVTLLDADEVSPPAWRRAVDESGITEVTFATTEPHHGFEDVLPSPVVHSIVSAAETTSHMLSGPPFDGTPLLVGHDTGGDVEPVETRPHWAIVAAVLFALWVLISALMIGLGQTPKREPTRIPPRSPEAVALEESLESVGPRNVFAVVETKDGDLDVATRRTIKSWWLEDVWEVSPGTVLHYRVTFWRIECRINGRVVRSEDRNRW